MRRILSISIALLALLTSLSFATENLPNDIAVLDSNTFLMVDVSVEGSEVIQLFKIENNQIILVDAIQIDEKKVNFKSLLEYRQLKIERKK
ncbi:MAG: hypothetical protein GWN77_02935 [Gammaproteobacteria bacterium]|nr:hypothetical protein [Gammaproteobacteria bacterium]